MKMNLFLENGITVAVYLGLPLRFTRIYQNFMTTAQEAALLWAHQSYLAYRACSCRSRHGLVSEMSQIISRIRIDSWFICSNKSTMAI